MNEIVTGMPKRGPWDRLLGVFDGMLWALVRVMSYVFSAVLYTAMQVGICFVIIPTSTMSIGYIWLGYLWLFDAMRFKLVMESGWLPYPFNIFDVADWKLLRHAFEHESLPWWWTLVIYYVGFTWLVGMHRITHYYIRASRNDLENSPPIKVVNRLIDLVDLPLIGLSWGIAWVLVVTNAPQWSVVVKMRRLAARVTAWRKGKPLPVEAAAAGGAPVLAGAARSAPGEAATTVAGTPQGGTAADASEGPSSGGAAAAVTPEAIAAALALLTQAMQTSQAGAGQPSVSAGAATGSGGDGLTHESNANASPVLQVMTGKIPFVQTVVGESAGGLDTGQTETGVTVSETVEDVGPVAAPDGGVSSTGISSSTEAPAVAVGEGESEPSVEVESDPVEVVETAGDGTGDDSVVAYERSEDDLARSEEIRAAEDRRVLEADPDAWYRPLADGEIGVGIRGLMHRHVVAASELVVLLRDRLGFTSELRGGTADGDAVRAEFGSGVVGWTDADRERVLDALVAAARDGSVRTGFLRAKIGEFIGACMRLKNECGLSWWAGSFGSLHDGDDPLEDPEVRDGLRFLLWRKTVMELRDRLDQAAQATLEGAASAGATEPLAGDQIGEVRRIIRSRVVGVEEGGFRALMSQKLSEEFRPSCVGPDDVSFLVGRRAGTREMWQWCVVLSGRELVFADAVEPSVDVIDERVGAMVSAFAEHWKQDTELRVGRRIASLCIGVVVAIGSVKPTTSFGTVMRDGRQWGLPETTDVGMMPNGVSAGVDVRVGIVVPASVAPALGPGWTGEVMDLADLAKFMVGWIRFPVDGTVGGLVASKPHPKHGVVR